MVAVRGVKGGWRCTVFVWPASFHPRQAGGRGAAGCGRGGSRAGLNDRALFGTAALVRIGPSQTIAGVTGPQRPRVRGLMSQYWAKKSRRVWSATTGSDGSDTATANLSVLFLAGGWRATVLLSYQRGVYNAFSYSVRSENSPELSSMMHHHLTNSL